MYLLKPYSYLFLLLVLISIKAHGQEEVRPSFPGGQRAFSQYILKNLKYPEVANLIGLTGKVYVRFVVETDGTVTHVTPYKCIGADCESEAARVIANSPKWHNGRLYGKPERVQFTIPVTFEGKKPFPPTKFDDLRKSKYSFLFYIRGKTYTLDEAQTIFGKSFDPKIIAAVEEHSNFEYSLPSKKAVYLIVMKDS